LLSIFSSPAVITEMVKVPEVAVFCSEVRVVPTVNVFVVRYENDAI